MALSEKSRAILEAIAKGHTYEQILVRELAWTYHDIFQAAADALETAEDTDADKAYDLKDIRRDHPRAYEPWNADEDGRLHDLFQAGKGVQEIAETLQRQRGAIRSRLAKLKLI